MNSLSNGLSITISGSGLETSFDPESVSLPEPNNRLSNPIILVTDEYVIKTHNGSYNNKRPLLFDSDSTIKRLYGAEEVVFPNNNEREVVLVK
jgi:hypothetical protein